MTPCCVCARPTDVVVNIDLRRTPICDGCCLAITKQTVATLTVEAIRQRLTPISPEVQNLRLQGYDAVPCPKCSSLLTVSSGGVTACDGCGFRGEKEEVKG